jgi:uncharacterized integral membrane protein (TIGR00697 family)
MAGFVAILLCSNVIGAAKVATVGGFTFGAGVLFFPLSYVLGDVLTEVYGYARARKVVWAGFAALGFASLMSYVIVAMPPADAWEEQVFGLTPRIALASLMAFWAGEIANAFVMAKMKIVTKGRHLWSRTIGSTVVGQGIDSLIFYPIAFLGIWETDLVIAVMISNYLLKVTWEAVLTPVTYKVVNALKRVEHEDFYDEDTDFNPFTLKT